METFCQFGRQQQHRWLYTERGQQDEWIRCNRCWAALGWGDPWRRGL